MVWWPNLGLPAAVAPSERPPARPAGGAMEMYARVSCPGLPAGRPRGEGQGHEGLDHMHAVIPLMDHLVNSLSLISLIAAALIPVCISAI